MIVEDHRLWLALWSVWSLCPTTELLKNSGDDHRKLATGITGTVREKTIIIALGALPAHGDVLYPRFRRLLGYQRPNIYVAGAIGLLTGELGTHILSLIHI